MYSPAQSTSMSKSSFQRREQVPRIADRRSKLPKRAFNPDLRSRRWMLDDAPKMEVKLVSQDTTSIASKSWKSGLHLRPVFLVTEQFCLLDLEKICTNYQVLFHVGDNKRKGGDVILIASSSTSTSTNTTFAAATTSVADLVPNKQPLHKCKV